MFQPRVRVTPVLPLSEPRAVGFIRFLWRPRPCASLAARYNGRLPAATCPGFDPGSGSLFCASSPNSSTANIDPFLLKLHHEGYQLNRLFSKFCFFKTHQFGCFTLSNGHNSASICLRELKIRQYTVPPIVLLIG